MRVCACVRERKRQRRGGVGGGCARENIHSSLTPRFVVCYMKIRLTFVNYCRACARFNLSQVVNLSQESSTQSKSISATVECWTRWHLTKKDITATVAVTGQIVWYKDSCAWFKGQGPVQRTIQQVLLRMSIILRRHPRREGAGGVEATTGCLHCK